MFVMEFIEPDIPRRRASENKTLAEITIMKGIKLIDRFI
jgi:hypothetical protein